MRDCATPCLEEIRPVEVLLPKRWTKKFAFLSPHVGRPGKAFLDHASDSKLYPWAKTNIKCSNRKKYWHVSGHRYTIPPRQTSPLPPLLIKILHYCPHVQHASSALLCRCAPLRWPALYMICTIHTERCQKACASALLRLRSLHMNGVVSYSDSVACT